MSTNRTRPFAFVAQLENRPGALNRVVSQFRNRGYDIDALTLTPSHDPGVSRLTFTMRTTAAIAKRMRVNLHKLLDVLHVEEVSSAAPVARELVLVKLAHAIDERSAVAGILEALRARVIDAEPRARVVEFAGSPEQVEALIEALRPFSVTEIARSGAVMMADEAPGPHGSGELPHASPIAIERHAEARP